jgi:hypothetical protein
MAFALLSHIHSEIFASSSVFTTFQAYTMSESLRYIHTQAQAQAELDRRRLMDRERYARNKRRRQQSSDYQTQLQSNPNTDEDTIRRRKQRGIQCDFFHVDPNTDADRKATMREARKKRRLEHSADELADILNKIRQRY